MRGILCLMLLLTTTGCAMYPTSSDGEFVTYKHGKALFSVAKSNAEEECATVDKRAKHDRTDCFQEACTSTFTCVGKHQE